ncbi:MAG TPA: VWA domain-containing protein [Thermoleophilaceae bacterium]
MTEFGVETVLLDLPPLVGAFGRRLREAGLPVTPQRSAELARALDLVRPITRRRLYWTARAVLVTDPGELKAFDRVFFTVFGGSEESFDPEEAAPRDDAPRDSTRGTAPSSAPGSSESARLEVPLALASDHEKLAGKSFDALEPHELAQLYRLMSRLELSTPLRRTRRYERGRHGQRIDMRRTLRGSLRTAGDPIRLARRHRRTARRRLVMLCDISGSMEPYARAYLQFLASAAGSGPNAEAFVFATRLTRLTRALGSRHPERAIERAAAAAPDWSSGTRIGDALKAFNDRHGRRGMARGAVVVILSDGWERGDPALVSQEMQRLARLAHRIVWVNPRVSAGAFSVQAGGMVAALPHCDALVSGHSFEALGEVAEAIGARSWKAPELPEAPVADEPEPWPSATPVPGSSVAMPSGHSPSRGRTTPGW